MAQVVHKLTPFAAGAREIRTPEKDLGRAEPQGLAALGATPRRKIALPGPEDVVVDHEWGIAFISSQERTRPLNQTSRAGAIYALDLNKEDALCVNLMTKKLLRTIGSFHPLGLDLFMVDGKERRLAVVNHAEGGCRIEIFTVLREDDGLPRLEHVCSLGPHELLTNPNGVAIASRNEVYVTNPRDLRALFNPWLYLKDMLHLRSGRILSCRFTDDGKATWAIADEGLSYPNGIAINRQGARPRVYVAVMNAKQIRMYAPAPDGRLERSGKAVDLPAMPDNLCLDRDGDLWIGASPDLLKAVLYFAGCRKTSPSAVLRISQPQSVKPVVETVFFDGGELISGSSVGCPYADGNRSKLLVGSVIENLLIVDLR